MRGWWRTRRVEPILYASSWDRNWTDDIEGVLGEMPTPMDLAAAELAANGHLSDDEIIEAVSSKYKNHGVERMQLRVDVVAANAAQRLRLGRPRAVRWWVRRRRQFERRLDWTWGDAFDRLDALSYACSEFANAHIEAHSSQRVDDDDLQCEALARLLARASLTTSEISALLRTGHGFGAMGRWRTLHEVCVIAAVLADCDVEISERFILHGVVAEYQDRADEADRLIAAGEDPTAVIAERDELKPAVDEILDRYGQKFATSDYAWALPIFPDTKRVTFRMLEERAEREHLRLDYRTACHLVHSDGWGAAMMLTEVHGEQALFSGPTNHHIAAPGIATAIALFQCAATVILHDDRDTHPDLVAGVLALRELVTDTRTAFEDGHRELDADIAEYDALGGPHAPRWRQNLMIARRYTTRPWRRSRVVRLLRHK